MKKDRSRATLNKLIYIIVISIAIMITLTIMLNTIFNVKIFNKVIKNEEFTQISVQEGANVEAKNITSRSSNDVRTAEKQEAKKIEEKKEENNNNAEAKSNDVKKEAKSTSTNTQKNNNTKKTSKKSTQKTTKKTESKKSATTKTSTNGVKISKDMDLTKRTGLSREEFIKLVSSVKADTSGFFEQNAGTIYDLCQKYSINEIFFCGLISAESGWNIASNHRSTHNYISLMKNGQLISYSSVSEGLEVAAKKLHYNYLTPGGKFYHGKTLAGVKTCFCPSSTWVDLVYGRMKQIV